MTVEELKALLDARKVPLVLDLREPYEVTYSPFPFEVLAIPLGSLPNLDGGILAWSERIDATVRWY